MVQQAQTALQQAQSAAEQANAAQQTLLAPHGGSLAQLRARWQAAQQQMQLILQLQQQASQRNALHQQEQQLDADLQECNQRMQQQAADLVSLRSRYKAQNEKVSDKEQPLAQERRIQNLEAHRRTLQPGEACPLCGSHEHPAITAYAALDISAPRPHCKLPEPSWNRSRSKAASARPITRPAKASTAVCKEAGSDDRPYPAMAGAVEHIAPGLRAHAGR